MARSRKIFAELKRNAFRSPKGSVTTPIVEYADGVDGFSRVIRCAFAVPLPASL